LLLPDRLPEARSGVRTSASRTSRDVIPTGTQGRVLAAQSRHLPRQGRPSARGDALWSGASSASVV